MKRIAMLWVSVVLVSSLAASRTLPGQAEERPAYRHGYYLFLADAPNGCEDCYVPLLITAEPLEKSATAKKPEAGVLIITYERDSIWHDDGIVWLEPGNIEAAPRIVHLRDRRYRYQEVSSAEVLKLLENPRGTIPVSRPYLPKADVPGPNLEELISDFRSAK